MADSRILDQVALGDVDKSLTVLKASIAGVKGSTAAYMRSSTNVSKSSKTTSIVAVSYSRMGREMAQLIGCGRECGQGQQMCENGVYGLEENSLEYFSGFKEQSKRVSVKSSCIEEKSDCYLGMRSSSVYQRRRLPLSLQNCRTRLASRP